MNEEKNNKKNKDVDIDKPQKEGYDNDIVYADVDPDGDTEVTSDVVKKLREKLRVCVEEKQEYLLGWQRTKADFVNARKADEENRKDVLQFAQSGLIEELLPVIESFEQAFGNKEAWEKVDKDWRIGVEYIYQKLISTLLENGLKELNPLGEKFEPSLHTSIEMVETENADDDHKIVEVFQKGYMLNGKILKPPNVKVAVHKGND